MWEDFKAFIMRGNVIDMAVGIIIGGAFGKIVSSFVNDIVMPPIGLLLAGVDFKDLYMNLSKTHYASLADAEAAGAPVIKYGLFINNCIDFLIIALVIFLVLRAQKAGSGRRNGKRMSVLQNENRHFRDPLPALHIAAE